VIVLPSHTIVYADEVGQAHVRVRLKSGDGAIINAIAFRALNQPLGHALLQYRGQSVHAAGTLALDRWNGNERIQLRLLDIAPVDPMQPRNG
jgi:single-stranded-DNA-specific exonuclease